MGEIVKAVESLPMIFHGRLDSRLPGSRITEIQRLNHTHDKDCERTLISSMG